MSMGYQVLLLKYGKGVALNSEVFIFTLQIIKLINSMHYRPLEYEMLPRILGLTEQYKKENHGEVAE